MVVRGELAFVTPNQDWWWRADKASPMADEKEPSLMRGKDLVTEGKDRVVKLLTVCFWTPRRKCPSQ